MIDDAGAEAFAKALRGNNTLAKVDLRNNHIRCARAVRGRSADSQRHARVYLCSPAVQQKLSGQGKLLAETTWTPPRTCRTCWL